MMKAMTATEVMTLLEAARDERGIAHWGKLGSSLSSYGIGLTKLRQLAKQIGRDRELAQTLWTSSVYDAKVIALLIDEPKLVTREQAEQQVEQLADGQLAHVFSSCDATLAKTDFAVELVDQWVTSPDAMRRACAYGLLYEASKFKGKKALPEAFLLAHIHRISRTIADETEQVRLAMATALMGIGKLTARLNAEALAVAEATGPIAFTSASGQCDPFDVSKHLISARNKMDSAK